MSRPPTVLRRLESEDTLLLGNLANSDRWRWETARMNIESYGLKSSYVTLWGAFTAGETALCGILTRFSNTVVVVDTAGECASLFAEKIDAEVGVVGIRGTMETITALCPYLQKYQVSAQEDSFYMALHQPPQCNPAVLSFARTVRTSDLERLVSFYSAAGHMYRSRANLLPKIGHERAFMVEEAATALHPARVASCALMNVEGKSTGMIGGVFTLPDARGKGYAQACVSALSQDLQRAGKMPTLFYENPLAGRIYSRIGFETVGHWKLLYLIPRMGAKHE